MTTSESTTQPTGVGHPTLIGVHSAALPALLAMAAGVVLLFIVGFAGPEILHNAAHDSRHSLSFPCH